MVTREKQEADIFWEKSNMAVAVIKITDRVLDVAFILNLTSLSFILAFEEVAECCSMV